MEAATCDTLPDEQWISIFSLLSAKDVLRISFVDQRFKRLALQVPFVNNTIQFYKNPRTSRSTPPLVAPVLQETVKLSLILKWLPGFLKNAMVLRMVNHGTGNQLAQCVGAMIQAGEVPTRLRTLEWRTVPAAELAEIAPLLQGNMREVLLQFLPERGGLSLLGGFLAAVAKACPHLQTLRLLAPSTKISSRYPTPSHPSDGPSDGDSDDDAPPRFADSDLEEEFKVDDIGQIFRSMEDVYDQMPVPGEPILPMPAGGVFPGMFQNPGDVCDQDEDEEVESDEESLQTMLEEELRAQVAGSGGKRGWGGGHAGEVWGGEEQGDGEGDAPGFPVFDSADVSGGEENAEEEGPSDEDGGGRGPRVPGAIDAGRRVQPPRKRGRVVLDQGHYRLIPPTRGKAQDPPHRGGRVAARDWPSDPGSSDSEGEGDDGSKDEKGPEQVGLPGDLNRAPGGKDAKEAGGEQWPPGGGGPSSLEDSLKAAMKKNLDAPGNEQPTDGADLPSSSKEGGLGVAAEKAVPVAADAPSASDGGAAASPASSAPRNEAVPSSKSVGGLGGPPNRAPALAESPAMGALDRLMDTPPEDWEKTYEEQFYANLADLAPGNLGPLAAAEARKHKAWERDPNGRRALLRGRLMPPVKNFDEAVRRLLQGCKVLKTLELPYGKVEHFSMVRHTRLETLRVKGMADVAYCTDAVNALTHQFRTLRHLSLSCSSRLPWGYLQEVTSNLGPVQSRHCASTTLESIEMHGFIYPGDITLDMPRLKRLVLKRPYRPGAGPDEETEVESDEERAPVFDLRTRLSRKDRPKPSDMRVLQLNCPALEDLRLGFPINGATLSEAGSTLPALRTLVLDALFEPEFVLSGGFPALRTLRLGLTSSCATSLTVEHPTVQTLTAALGSFAKHLDGRKHVAISCRRLEALEVRGPTMHRRFFPGAEPPDAATDGFLSEIWAPCLRTANLPGRTAALPATLKFTPDVEELKIHVKTAQDTAVLGSLRKLRKLQIYCDKGCDVVAVDSESLVEFQLVAHSCDLRQVHVAAPQLTELDLCNPRHLLVHLRQLKLALGHVTELLVPFGVTSLKFAAQCPRLEKVQLLAYLGDAVRVDSSSFPAIKTLQMEMPKAKPHTLTVQSKTLECFKLLAFRSFGNPSTCSFACPELTELHLNVLPPSLTAIGAGCPKLETLVVAGGLHLDPDAQSDPKVVEKLTSRLTGQDALEQIRSLRDFLPDAPDMSAFLQDNEALQSMFATAMELADPNNFIPEASRRQMFSAIRAAMPSLLPALHNAGGIPLDPEALNAPVGEGKAKGSAEEEAAPGGAAEPGEQGMTNGGEESGAAKGAKRPAESEASGSAKRVRLNDMNMFEENILNELDGRSSSEVRGGAERRFDPLGLGAKQSRKGKEKVEEGGKEKRRTRWGENKVVWEYQALLGEEFPSLKELHIQVWTVASPAPSFQRRFRLSSDHSWCICPGPYSSHPTMHNPWEDPFRRMFAQPMRRLNNGGYAPYGLQDGEDLDAYCNFPPAPFLPDYMLGSYSMNGEGRAVGPSTSTAAPRAPRSAATQVEGDGPATDAPPPEEPFVSRLTQKEPIARGGMYGAVPLPSIDPRKARDALNLSPNGPSLVLDVTCPKLREAQVFSDLQLRSATVACPELRCLRGWIAAEGGRGIRDGVRLVCPKMEKMDWQIV
ncbi:hypothetical protein KFL_001310030 [Klebsormidium nitens]|uniref:F-box domain-containing protein n=1 Tax=Klebsormidium nitens TaxID=105231 RepID=A0A1Y1I1B8_KLENI|nr:hypothetical protein KFL_001310030 [Klebsormidium nitens]|eukprot:GAQ82971.1 hypothetical protein KFL_001310030 [Klebsormidium nitens]